jgi:hypothetical protein
MKPKKKTLEAIKEIEKKVSEVCYTNDGVVDEITGMVYPKKTIKESNLREVIVKLSFGECSPSLKYQLQEQGFTLRKEVVKDAENIRMDLFALNQTGILSSKQLLKCFKKLSKQISKMVASSKLKDDEIATHIKTIIS